MAKKKISKKKRYEKAICPFLNRKCIEHKCRIYDIDGDDCSIVIGARKEE